MTEVWRAKFILGTFLTTLCIVLSYELKSIPAEIPRPLLVATSFFISTYLSSMIVRTGIQFKTGRKLIMGKTWLEGYWFLSTSAIDGNKHNITQNGITFISYTGEEYILKVITYRLIGDQMHTGLPSLSDMATIRSFDLKYSNIFTISDGKTEAKGITVGEFFSDGTSPYPNRYEGHVVLFNEGMNRRQSATKIPEKVIRSFKRKNNTDWMDRLLNALSMASASTADFSKVNATSVETKKN